MKQLMKSVISIFSVLLFIMHISPVTAFEAVRVGVVQQPGYCEEDEDGYMRGMDAEYMYKIAQYASLDVTFVSYDNYAVLQEDLSAGKVDMALGMSKSEEREEKFLFAETPFATGPLSLRVREDDARYETIGTAMLAEMKIGVVISGSGQKEKALKWAEENGVSLNLVDYEGEDLMIADLNAGKLDGMIAGGLISPGYRSVLSFAATAYYPVFNRTKADLKLAVDTAMTRILKEDPQYAEKLIRQYLSTEGTSAPVFTVDEKDYIESHPVVKAAVMSPDAPYYVPGEGGIVVDFYDAVSELTGLTFEFVEYETQDEVYQAVMNGDADLMAVVHRGVIEATKAGVILTAGYLTQDVVRITRNGTTVVNRSALVEPDVPNYHYLAGDAGHEELVGYRNVEECFNALRRKEVDSVVCTMAQATWLMNQRRFSGYQIATLFGKSFTASGAVRPDNAVLASVISKAVSSYSIDTDNIIAQNTGASLSFDTILHWMPVEWIVLFFALVSGILLALVYSHFHNRRLMDEARVEAAQAKMRASEQAKEAEAGFLANMSHDMRTPLNGIIGFTDLALQDPDPDTRQKYIEKINTSGRIMLDLVNDILDLSKIESGRMELHNEKFRLNRIYSDVESAVRVTAEKRNIHLVLNAEESEDVWVNADRVHLQQIALNLLGNAIKYTPEGGHVTWTVKTERKGDTCGLVCIVEDDGIGMSEAFQKTMFDAFQMENRAEASRGSGTGLGLTIVKRLVDLMNGTIDVESRLDEGTKFTVKVDVPFAEAEEETEVKETADIKGCRILLCEDNPINTEIGTLILKNAGVSVVDSAENGKIGVEKYLSHEAYYYDAVLMDLRMPEMDGIEAAKAIRSADRMDASLVPIIAMTADAYEEDVRKCRDAGMNDHVSKPVQPEVLVSSIASCIADAKRNANLLK